MAVKPVKRAVGGDDIVDYIKVDGKELGITSKMRDAAFYRQVKGMTQVKAMLKAGYSESYASQNASKFWNGTIMQALCQGGEIKVTMRREEWDANLVTIANDPDEAGSNRFQALKMIGQKNGWMENDANSSDTVFKKEQTAVEKLSDKELVAEAERLGVSIADGVLA